MSISDIRRIACIGEVMIELIQEEADRARFGVAGDTYNTAVYLRRLLGAGRSVDYVTALGTDPFSDMILDRITGFDLGAGNIDRVADKSPGLYAIATAPDGERSFTYWRSDSAARTMFGPQSGLSPQLFDTYDLILLSGITLAILPAAVRGVLMEGLASFRAAGGLVAYDSNHRPRLWETPAAAREVNAAMWAMADIALPSVDDEMALFGDVDEAAAIARLHGYGVRVGALKRGAEGPLDLSGQIVDAQYPAAPHIVDTTAAGDSFNAGFLAGLIQSGNVDTALQSGHAIAAKVIQARGAIVDT